MILFETLEKSPNSLKFFEKSLGVFHVFSLKPETSRLISRPGGGHHQCSRDALTSSSTSGASVFGDAWGHFFVWFFNLYILTFKRVFTRDDRFKLEDVRALLSKRFFSTWDLHCIAWGFHSPRSPPLKTFSSSVLVAWRKSETARFVFSGGFWKVEVFLIERIGFCLCFFCRCSGVGTGLSGFSVNSYFLVFIGC